MILRVREDGYWFYCPGCEDLHRIDDTWTFNNDPEVPTFRPSILVRGAQNSRETICHSYVTDGRIMFLTESTHPLYGQTVPLPPLPKWFLNEKSPK